MFTAALLTIAKLWKQPKYQWTDEWMKKWYTYKMEYSSQALSKILLKNRTCSRQIHKKMLNINYADQNHNEVSPHTYQNG